MIGARLRFVIMLGIVAFVGVEILQSLLWLKSELLRQTALVDGILSPVWLGPLGNVLLGLIQGGVLFTLLSIDHRLATGTGRSG